jgi:hypothetical protein
VIHQMFAAGGRNMSPLQVASAASVFINPILSENKERRGRHWWQTQLCRSGTANNGASLLADLKFQEVSGQFANLTLMAPADFEFPINVIGPKTAKKDATYRAAVPVEERLAVTLRVLATGDSYTSLQSPWLWSASELCRPSDRRFLAK